MTLTGPTLTSNVHIPSEKFRPESSTVPFSIEATSVAVGLTLPKWHTNAMYSSPATNDIGRVSHLLVDGRFFYHTEHREDFVDRLNLLFKVFSTAL